MKKFTRSEAKVLRALIGDQKDQDLFQVSVIALAKTSGLSRSTIERTIASLTERRIILKTSNRSGNWYELLEPIVVSKTRIKIGSWATAKPAQTRVETETPDAGVSRKADDKKINNPTRTQATGNKQKFDENDAFTRRHQEVELPFQKPDKPELIPSRAGNERPSSLRSSGLGRQSPELASSLRSEASPPKVPPKRFAELELDEKLRRWAENEKVHPANVEPMFEAFQAYHVRKGTVTKRMDLAWLRWIERAKEFEPELFGRSEPPPVFGTGKIQRKTFGSGHRPDIHKPNFGLEAVRKLASSPFGTGMFNPASCPPSEGQIGAKTAKQEPKDFSAERELSRLKKIC